MIPSAGIVLTSLVIALFEVPKLKKEKAYKELFVFCFFLVNGTVLGILSALRVKIPNPVDWLIVVFKPISLWIERMLA
ncbi:hypothetical protein [Bacillus marasmi]|uniref:hypothetical protein n=1 Tax=Bacillus marasmi TaxID=1926279 RepID=UPI0011CC7D0F|nr:hypothetical protein [Bacillus marasmi]